MCGQCCRGSLIRLDEEDRAKLAEQGWEQHPDFAWTRVVVREGWGNSYRLAQRPDGSCVFLTSEGRCRVHEEYGLEAKPRMCRLFPLQVVPLQKQALLTLRRSCPSAAADLGRPVAEHLPDVQSIMSSSDSVLREPPAAPRVRSGWKTSWDEALWVMNALERLVTDQHFPLVRRIVHGLHFSRQLQQCRLRKLQAPQQRELIGLLESSAPGDCGSWFQDRRPPHRAALVLFRQTAAEYMRLHPGFVPESGFSGRLRLGWAAFRLARAKGETPALHPDFAPLAFEELELPLGHLHEEVLRPLNRFFETMTASKQYAMAGRGGWSVLESFQSLSLGYAVALWLLRWKTAGRTPLAEDIVALITMLDRGQGFAPLVGSRHRRRVRTLADMDQLQCFAAWYAR